MAESVMGCVIFHAAFLHKKNFREKGIAERPQTLRYSEIKNSSPAKRQNLLRSSSGTADAGSITASASAASIDASRAFGRISSPVRAFP